MAYTFKCDACEAALPTWCAIVDICVGSGREEPGARWQICRTCYNELKEWRKAQATKPAPKRRWYLLGLRVR